MGIVQIPPNPVGAAHLKVFLDLQPAELRTSIDLLQAVVRKLQQDGRTFTLTRQAAPSPAPAAPAPAPVPTPAPVASAPAAAPSAQAPQAPIANGPARAAPLASVAAAPARAEAYAPNAAARPGVTPSPYLPYAPSSGPAASLAYAPPAAPAPSLPAAPLPALSLQPQQQRAPVSMPAPSVTAPPPPAMRPPAYAPPAAPAAVLPAVAAQAAGMRTMPTSMPVQPQASTAAAAAAAAAVASARTQSAAAAAAAAASAARQQQQQAYAAPPPAPPARTAQPAPFPSTTTRTAPPPAPAALPSWEMCHITDKLDHNSDPVMALAYCETLEGLPGGDGHGGWLISSSRRLLNLWECNAGGGRGMPSLMMLHSQETDFASHCLTPEPKLQLMYAASAEAGRLTSEALTVHSLSADAGVLAFKYKFPMPAAPGAPAPPPARPGQPPPPAPRLFNKVASLCCMGGALTNCCAAAYSGSVLVYEAPGLAGAPPAGARPKGSWKASEVAITALTAGTLGGMWVATGARDGAVALWDMRARPPTLAKRLVHQQAVTGLVRVNETTLASSSLDGKVCLWDLRNVARPSATATPDASAVLGVKISPSKDCLAVSTQKGLHTVDLLDGRAEVKAITGSPLPRPYTDIVWNSATLELYAAAGQGTVSVFRQVYGQG